MTVRKYHPVLVALHWLLGLLLILQLAGGYFAFAPIPTQSPDKLSAFSLHATLGMGIGTLMLVRLIARLFTAKPQATAHQSQGIGQLRTPVHLFLYILVFVIVASGWYTGWVVSDVWAKPGTMLPDNFKELTPRIIHAWLALALFLVVVLHIAAAIRERMTGDKTILSRMAFGKRKD
jgi:cytochrome b561